MITLGHFKYHIYEIKFEGNDDETEYLVTCTQRTLRTMNDPITEDTDHQVYKFDGVGSARDAYEHGVKHCIAQTSRSDVSIFQQQTNGV